MKNKFNLRKFIFSGLMCLALIILVCPFVVTDTAIASPRQFTASESIFLRTPTYSTYYNDKIYTFDKYDNFLKTYDNSTSAFESEYLSLEGYELVDAMYLDKYLFALAKYQSLCVILQIDIETKQVLTLNINSLNELYTEIFVQTATFDDAEMYLISLTNKINEQDVTPLLIFANKTNFDVNFECKVTFDSSQSNILAIQNNLFKMIATPSSETEIRLMFVHETSVSFTHISLTTAKSGTAQITSITPLYDALENTNTDIKIVNVNIININTTPHFAITYAEQNNENTVQNTQIYNYNIGDGTNTKFEKKTYVSVSNSPYVLTNGEYLIYPDGQTIHYDKFSLVGETYNCEGDSISNPVLEINYFEDSNFVYKTTITTTLLLKNPWDANEIISIPNNADIIQIGTSSVKSTGYVLADYVVCLYTANDTNYIGYIKLEDTQNKDIVDITDYKYNPIFTVYAGTKLYSLPTKVVGGDKITDTLYPAVLREIDANLKVYVVNTICNYSANNSMMVKVKVNDEIGYIDCNSIIKPSEHVDFLITNATIKKDGTNVYSCSDLNSTVNDVLNKNKAVQIQGKRNAENGFTYIVYNDEYGNVLDGYVKTDFLETSTWTTLQIIGCVLIAINVGLLILILVFKNRKIGHNGEKYKAEEKSNYKENAISSPTAEE